MTAAAGVSRTTAGIDVLRLLPLYLGFGFLKHLVALPRLARWAAADATTDRDDAGQADRILQAALRLSRYLGRLDQDCLQRSLVLYRMLSREGAEPRLLMGFRRDATGVQGHAWVEIGESCESLTAEDVSGYAVALSFGPAGALTEGRRPPSADASLKRDARMPPART